MDEQSIRRSNLLKLYMEFKAEYMEQHPTDSGRGVDARFAEKLNVKGPSLSTMKSGSRAIGPTLARQFEGLCGKPSGWMDIDRGIENDEAKELQAFLKLAKRAFVRASSDEKKALVERMQSSLSNLGEKL